MSNKTKKAILICSCSGMCPSMKEIDFWELSERIRITMDDEVEFIAIHPRLCEENGERLMENLLKQDTLYITPACKEDKQKKLLRDGFSKANVSMEKNWIPISLSFKKTDEVFDEIQKIVKDN